MRVVFCGNPGFAVPTLETLLASSHEVTAVVCSPDKPRGRGQKLQPLPVKDYALRSGVPVLQPVKLMDPDFLSSMRQIEPDCFVVVAFRILPHEMFALPRLGSFNVHPSLLPRGRGPAPIPWTLIRGETETGVTIIRLSEEIDGGDILLQERIPVSSDDNYGTLHGTLSQLGAKLLLKVLDACETGNPPPALTQDASQVTKAPKLFANDFELDWTLSAIELVNRIRAFSPFPGATTMVKGKRLKILSAAETDNLHNLLPGQIKQTDRESLLVGTGYGALWLKSIQPEGKRPMTVGEFLRGRPHLPERFGQ